MKKNGIKPLLALEAYIHNNPWYIWLGVPKTEISPYCLYGQKDGSWGIKILIGLKPQGLFLKGV